MRYITEGGGEMSADMETIDRVRAENENRAKLGDKPKIGEIKITISINNN